MADGDSTLSQDICFLQADGKPEELAFSGSGQSSPEAPAVCAMNTNNTNPQIRAYSFEMSLIVFLCDEVVPTLVSGFLPEGPIQTLEIRIAIPIAFKYFGIIYLATQSFVDQNICINLPISIMRVLLSKDP